VTSLVVEPDQVAAIAAAIARAPLVAFDLEFLSQERLVPELCLIQVAWPQHAAWDAAAHAAGAPAPGPGPEPALALVDPLAVDVRPIVDAIAAHACAVAHAARQDLQLLATRFGASVRGIADTQVMAAFAGLGDQIGLAALAGELAGATLDKEHQWTDWARRPLAPAQLAYAAADVRHLPAIHAALAARLGERVAWARAESAAVAAEAEAAARVTPETAWRQLGGTRGLDAAAFAAVVALAAWRQRTALELDRPLGQVLNDRALIDLGRQRPRTAEAVRAVKGLSPLARQRAPELVAAIADAPPVAAPVPAAWRPASPRAQRWAEALVAIAQIASERTGVAARLLATRADAEALARAVDERGLDAARELPALATWRREVLGELWIGWLTGALALIGDLAAPSGLDLVPRDPR
jgi:ribonuclease D